MTFFFLILAGLTVASALGVVALRSPVHSALSLILNLLCVAGIFASLGAHFLAVIQVIVYAGAIMVLFMFVLMLLSAKIEKYDWWMLFYLPAGAALVLVFGSYFLAPLLEDSSVFPQTAGPRIQGTVWAVGRLLFTRYVFPFEIASVLILAAIVGAVLLARRRS